MKLSVIIPVYNEENNIKQSSEKLIKFLSTNFDDYEIVFCNDGSTDSTNKLITEISKTNSKIKVVGYKTNMGKGFAVRTAVANCESDILLYTDCDLAYGLDIIKTAYDDIIKRNCDILIGSRNINKESYEGYTLIRKIVSKLYFFIIKKASGFKHSDSQCGFKCFKTEVAKTVFRECTVNGFAFDLEVLLRAGKKGYSIEELPVRIIQNENKNSKVHIIKDSIKMLRDIKRIKKEL